MYLTYDDQPDNYHALSIHLNTTAICQTSSMLYLLIFQPIYEFWTHIQAIFMSFDYIKQNK